jgi:Putative heavy-metal-binding
MPGAGQAFDSGLTIPDFAACVSMHLQPLALVQGYFYGQISSWSTYSGYPVRNYPCACYEVNVHNTGWLGRVDDLDRLWMTAYQTALDRMLQEAAQLGAHGVVGVTTEMSHPTNANSSEVHLYGTAVVSAGAPPPEHVWSTELAGHKLAKLVEIGYVPRSVAYARCTAMLVEGCNMEYYGSGRCGTGYVINPLQDAHELARSGAIDVARKMSPETSMYGVDMEVHESEGSGTTYITCSVRGSLVRRVRATMPVGAPIPTVSLAV